MHAFDVLGDPIRRRILELLADGEQTSGAVTEVIRAEFGVSQPAVSQHLRVLRDNGFATVRAAGARRLYTVDDTGLRQVDAWLGPFRRFWTPHLAAMATEVARGKRARRLAAGGSRADDPPSRARTTARNTESDVPGATHD
ncbi:ArsR/SmtB family transcription factor [Krasilnikovia sp. MM14-A1004]|uniref:ArsR/SmtB family transcription factor n=1 Tax=Krasilnikovia sp. MM14-A1004 TaxID=3373541 RepID=UPI00399C90B5